MSIRYQEKPVMYPSVPTVEADIRDPNDINKHLRLDFFNVIAEPDQSAYSFPCFHTAANAVYHYSKLFIYRLLAILVGLPLMLVWGLVFGVYTFVMIWIGAPMRRLTQSAIAEMGLYVQTACDAVIAPLYRSFGLVLSNMGLSLFNQTMHPPQQIEL